MAIRFQVLIFTLVALSSNAAPSPSSKANDFYSSGLACFNKLDWSGSISNSTRALELDTNLAFAYGQRGVAEMNQGIPAQNWNELEAAKEDLTRYLQFEPHATNAFRMYVYHSDIAINQAYAIPVHGKPTDYADYALENLEQCIRLKSDYAPAYFRRGWIKQNMKNDLNGALLDYNQAIKLAPNDQTSVAVYWLRAKIKEAKGDLTGAKIDRDKARSLNPEMVAAGEKGERENGW